MKGDQMGILAADPTQRELPLSNQTRFSCRVFAVPLLFEPPNFHRGLGAAGRDEQEKENVCHRGFLSRIAASDSEWARGTRSRYPVLLAKARRASALSTSNSPEGC